MSELEKFEKLFSEGKITRREFMAKVSALGLAAAGAHVAPVSRTAADVEAVAGEVRFIGDSGSPAFLAGRMDVSG
mgnify:CR=1 FL=1